MFYFRRPEAVPNLDNMSSIPRFNLGIYIYILLDLLDSSKSFFLQGITTPQRIRFPAMTAGGHWSLSDLEYFGAEEVRGLMTSGWKWAFFVGIWVKQGTFLHPYATMCAMLRMKTLEISWFSWIALGWNHLQKFKTIILLPNQVMLGVDGKVLLDFSASLLFHKYNMM